MLAKRTTVCWLVLPLVLGLGGAVVYSLAHSRPRPCRATFERVVVGMTRGEVVAVVGGPAGDYSTHDLLHPPFGTGYWGHKRWLSDDGLLMVLFDDAGRSSDVRVLHVQPLARPTLFERAGLAGSVKRDDSFTRRARVCYALIGHGGGKLGS